MVRILPLILFALGFLAPASAQEAANWQRVARDGGIAAEYPAALFDQDGGPTERGDGRRYLGADGKYEFALFRIENTRNETPRRYLAGNLLIDPAAIQYRRVTDRFFVISGERGDQIYYSRCNFRKAIHCLYVGYPKAEEKRFDPIVTRISRSLR